MCACVSLSINIDELCIFSVGAYVRVCIVCVCVRENLCGCMRTFGFFCVCVSLHLSVSAGYEAVLVK